MGWSDMTKIKIHSQHKVFWNSLWEIHLVKLQKITLKLSVWTHQMDEEIILKIKLTTVLFIFIWAVGTLLHPITGVGVGDAEAKATLKLVIRAVCHPDGTSAAIRQQRAARRAATLHLCPFIQLADVLAASVEYMTRTAITYTPWRTVWLSQNEALFTYAAYFPWQILQDLMAS